MVHRKPFRGQLSEAIRESGLSVDEFSALVLVRHPRTVQRWLAGDSPIPEVVRDWLKSAPLFAWSPGSVSITVDRR